STEQVLTLSARGPTPGRALANLSKITSRKLYLGHLQAVVIGEDLARQGIGGVIDGLMRDPVANRRARVFLAHRARDILAQPTPGELLPTLYFMTFFTAKASEDFTADVPLWRIWHDLLMPARAAYLPTVGSSQGQFQLQGLALLSDNRLVDRLDGNVCRGLKLARGEVRTGNLTIKAGGQTYTVRILGSRRWITAAWWEEDEAHLQLGLRVFGTLTENGQLGTPVTSKVYAALEEAVAAQVRTEAEAAIKVAQAAGADVFNFGEYMRVADPRRWDPRRWPDKFRTAVVKVVVEVRIENSGILD
ncbi:MAG: Ger(x)C family spore germination protein, partial [Firmicutes bacterium]|nr:Ger(x)C family spore germination protein [Bacillota bacterium]